ncbi:sugar ABC transporter substrate-binding protein [Salinibacterium sp. G-O1]|uniref:ABC transporter substrate-binding protein n=1 Tax=Salinibacterium sp. G-O1 TaxID=3046208 RepID=UPI0024B8FE62|nr:sugar ABC transporter substrate-binding protein [Salinibacterium sp. G-O1]MDJ0333886.1 sugar ABC transporter substrate-binding protein [Salinibacterium sp. G-O1]
MNTNHTKHARRIGAAFTSMLMVGALAACSTEPALPDEPVDLTVALWSANEAHLALFNEIGAAYVEANPDLVSSITFETIPFDAYTSTLTTRIAAGDPPDLAWMFESSAPEFVDAGALVDLTETLSATEGYDFEDLNPSAMKLWTESDSTYAYPFSTTPQIFMVNNDLFHAAGIPTAREMLEAGDWTWDGIRDSSAAILAATGKPGFPVRLDPAVWQYLALIWEGFGASPWSEDGTECTFDSPEMVEALEFIRDGVYVDAAFPKPGSNFDFFSGGAAMDAGGISQANKLDGSFDWDVLPLPEGPAGQVNIIGQAGIGVLKAGDNHAQAAGFLAYYSNPENAAKLAQFFPAPRLSLTNVDVLGPVNPVLSADQLQEIVVDTVTDAQTFPSHANFAAISNAVQPLFDGIWTADSDIPSIAADVCGVMKPLLER